MSSSTNQFNNSENGESQQSNDESQSDHNVVDLSYDRRPEAGQPQNSYWNENFLDSMKEVHDLLGKWGFQSCQQTFWDNEVTMHSLEHLNYQDLSELCQLSKLSIGPKTLLRLRIEGHFKKSSSINSVENPVLSTEQQPLRVRDILKESPKGDILLLLQKLNDTSRNLIVENIVNYYLDKKFILEKERYTKIASEIVQIFPKESTIVFYKPASTFNGKYHKATGKLVDKYNNEKGQRKRIMEDAMQPNTMTIEPIANLTTSIVEEVSLEEQTFSKKWLKTSRTPVDLVHEHWKKCFGIRQDYFRETREIKEILLAWPLLGSPMCPDLINFDFEMRYEKKMQLFEMWPNFLDTVRLKIKNIKDPSSKLFARNLKKNLTIDGTNIVICYLLPSIIIPTFKKNLAEKNEPKNYWKPTISESIRAFIIHAQNATQMEMLIQERQKFVAEKGLSFQPIVIVLGGEEVYEGQNFYCWFNGIVQKFGQFIQAIDFAFKLSRIFNLNYSEDCQQIWTFFQVYFYKIPTDIRIASVDNFISNIND